MKKNILKSLLFCFVIMGHLSLSWGAGTTCDNNKLSNNNPSAFSIKTSGTTLSGSFMKAKCVKNGTRGLLIKTCNNGSWSSNACAHGNNQQKSYDSCPDADLLNINTYTYDNTNLNADGSHEDGSTVTVSCNTAQVSKTTMQCNSGIWNDIAGGCTPQVEINAKPITCDNSTFNFPQIISRSSYKVPQGISLIGTKISGKCGNGYTGTMKNTCSLDEWATKDNTNPNPTAWVGSGECSCLSLQFDKNNNCKCEWPLDSDGNCAPPSN